MAINTCAGPRAPCMILIGLELRVYQSRTEEMKGEKDWCIGTGQAIVA